MTQLYDEYLAHYGIKGQKWGIRRFQNEDGSLTQRGKINAQREQKKSDPEKQKKDVAARRARTRSFLKAAGLITLGVALAGTSIAISKSPYEVSDLTQKVRDNYRSYDAEEQWRRQLGQIQRGAK